MSLAQSIDPNIRSKLDPVFVKYYEEEVATKSPTHRIPLEEVRRDPHKFAAKWALNALEKGYERVQDWNVETTDSASITVRSYHPGPTRFGPGPYPVHVNFHGGGWVFGNLDNDAEWCLHMRDTLPLVIIDVDYRLCPDVKFGQNVEDAWSALLWVRSNAQKLNVLRDSISIGGISAGAHFAAVLQHRARDEGLPLKLAILAVPPMAEHFEYESPGDSPFRSFSEFSKAPMLDWERIRFFHQYVYPADLMPKLRQSLPPFWFSPLKAPNFMDLCHTFIATAECDPLRDEGEAYGFKLVEAGIKVTFRRYRGVPHPFMHMTAILQQAIDYEEDCIEILKQAHGI